MIRITDIHKSFGTLEVLRGVSLEVAPREVVSIVGASGAGKTTLLQIIGTLSRPDSGRVEIDGTDITMEPEYKRAKYIGRVFQDPMKGTCAGMQIEENLALAKRRGQHRGLGWQLNAEERTLYRQQLQSLGLGLETRLSDKVGLLSGGQRQAVTLLMATLQKPKLLLLDEHTAALDPATAAKVLKLTCEIVEENHLTALMVTHNMKDAINIGNRLIMMDSGRIIYDVSGEEKMKLTVEDLLHKFEEASGTEFANDRMMLSN